MLFFQLICPKNQSLKKMKKNEDKEDSTQPNLSSPTSNPLSSSLSSPSSILRKMKSLSDIYERYNLCCWTRTLWRGHEKRGLRKVMLEEMNVIQKNKKLGLVDKPKNK